jgi:hypothetical protein
MRYQEPIYIQNDNSAVRNKDILNVNMSSDICIFGAPLFTMSGASKIDCTGTTGTTYVISTATTIPLSFNFTGNTDSFTANSATFKYEIYKYNSNANSFVLPPVYKSEVFNYSGFSGTSILSQNIPVNNLGLDGEYLIKGYYQFSACTNFLGQLGKTVDTLTYRAGKEYNLYDGDLDFYFIAFKAADKPKFVLNGNNTPAENQLFQQVILAKDKQTNFVISNSVAGYFAFTLNGLVLAPNLDYTFSGNVVTLVEPTVKGDVVTVIYTTSGGNNLIGDNILVSSPIISGVTDGQGTNDVYYNTTTNKYELYTSVEPASGGSILVMINGATLALNIDYYQSISNLKRIILEGDIIVGDIITIVYFPSVTTVNGISTPNPNVTWTIKTVPQLSNGVFTLEVSTTDSFLSIYESYSQPYIVGSTMYNSSFAASGTVGTQLYYRVKNEKIFVSLCGYSTSSINYSDIIPITIQTNSINSY